MELAALLVDDGHSDPPLDALGNGARSRLARQPIVSSGLLVLDCVVWGSLEATLEAGSHRHLSKRKAGQFFLGSVVAGGLLSQTE